MNSWLEPARSGQGKREIPRGGSPWLEPQTLFSTQTAGRSSLFCISGPCLLPHTTNPKQTNLSVFSGHCQALVLWAASPYLSSQLHRPSSPCQTTFFYTDVPSPSTTSQFVCFWSHSLLPHFISRQRSDPKPIEMFPSASMGFESGPTSLSLSGILSCLWVNVSPLFARPLFPFLFHSAMEYDMKPPLSCMAHPCWQRCLRASKTEEQKEGIEIAVQRTLAEGRTTFQKAGYFQFTFSMALIFGNISWVLPHFCVN